MKFTSLTLMLLGAIYSINAQSSEFKFNNKNLNALMALVCHSNLENAQAGKIYLHKMLVDKSMHGQSTKDTSYELSGTCNIEYDKKTKEVSSYGEEFNVEFSLSKLNSIKGKIGIKDIVINLRGNNLTHLTIKDPLMMTKKTFKLSTSNWAGSDSIFNFQQKQPFQLKVGRKTAAVEKNATLNFDYKVKSTFFNTWSYESFGCSQTGNSLEETTCSSLLKKLK